MAEKKTAQNMLYLVMKLLSGQYNVKDTLLHDNVKVPFSSFKSTSKRQMAPDPPMVCISFLGKTPNVYTISEFFCSTVILLLALDMNYSMPIKPLQLINARHTFLIAQVN